MANLGAYTKLLVRDVSSVATDVSHFGHTVTLNGSAVLSSAQKIYNQNTIDFPGTIADFASVTGHADFDLKDNNFTLDCWVRFDSVAAGQCFTSKWDADTSNRSYMFRWSQSSNELVFQYSTTGSDTPSFTGSWTPSINTWYHLRVIRSGADLKMFVDGVQKGSTGNIGSATIYENGSSATVRIGAYKGASAIECPMNGFIGQPRIINGQALATAAFTPPVAPDGENYDEQTALMVHSDYDSTGDSFDADDAFTGTNGDPPDTERWTETDALSKMSIQSNHLDFDSSESTTTTAKIESKFLIKGNFDIQIDFSIAYLGEPSGGNHFAPQFHIEDVDGTYVRIIRAKGGSTNKYIYQGTSTTWDESWTGSLAGTGKLRLTRSGSTIKGYAWENSQWEWNGNTAGVTFSDTFTGPVSVRVLFQQKANTQLDAYVDNFTVNSGTVITPTQLTMTDSSNLANSLTTQNVYHSTTQEKFGESSLYFDGETYLSAAAADTWYLEDHDWALDFWIRWDSVSVDQTLIGLWDADGVSKKSWLLKFLQSENVLRFYYSTDGSGSSYFSFAWDPSINTWYHVALVRSGADLECFIDGAQVGSTENIGTTALYDADTALRIGVTSGGSGLASYLEGYLDEVRISKGLARWTAAFTPPTRAYGEMSQEMPVRILSSKVDAALTDFPVALVIDDTATGAGDFLDEILVGTDDDFTGTDTDPPNPNRWKNSAGSAEILSNQLRMEAGTAVTSFNRQACFTVTGDFDIQVDLDCVDTPATNSWMWDLRLSHTVDSAQWCSISRKYVTSPGHCYEFRYDDNGSNDGFHRETTAESGSRLRLTRSGSTISGYQWTGSEWNQIGTSETWVSGPVYIKLNFWRSYSGTTMRADFDDFAIVGGTPVWDDNRSKRYKIVDANGKQCFIEHEMIDTVNRKLVGHFKVPSISSSADTVLTLKYDKEKPNNTDYIGVTGAVPAQLVWDDDFTEVWHMAQDPSGGSNCVKDSTKNENHATPAGSMTSADLIDGKIGKAIEFDGVDDRLVSSLAGFSPVIDHSIEALVKEPVGDSEANLIISQKDGTGTGRSRLYVEDHVADKPKTSLGGTGAAFNTTFPADTWTYLAYTYDYSETTIYFKFNGAADGSNSSITGEAATGAYVIGAHKGEASQWWNGAINELRVSKTMRSNAWIKATHNSLNDTLVLFTTGDSISAPAFNLSLAASALPCRVIPADTFELSLGFDAAIEEFEGLFYSTIVAAEIFNLTLVQSATYQKQFPMPPMQLSLGFDAKTAAFTMADKSIYYFCVLTGEADSTTNVTLPISSFQGRLRDGEATFLTVVIPSVDYADEIAARPNGEIIVQAAYGVNGVIYQREEIVRVELEDIRTDEGSQRQSITLSGHKTDTYENKTVALQNVIYKYTAEGKVRYRCATVDVFLRPGDTATYNSESITVGMIQYIISAQTMSMDVFEA